MEEKILKFYRVQKYPTKKYIHRVLISQDGPLMDHPSELLDLLRSNGCGPAGALSYYLLSLLILHTHAYPSKPPHTTPQAAAASRLRASCRRRRSPLSL